MKKILTAIFEPLKAISSKNISEFLWNLFNKNMYLVYILAFLTTGLIIYITYFN